MPSHRARRRQIHRDLLPRHLVACGIALPLLVILALACGAPPTSSGPDSPAAQATNVRRTEVARVQLIIANQSTPTPLPQPTATPTPTCRNAIWWTEARSHVGETRTVQGPLVETRAAPAGTTLLEMGVAYPDPLGMIVQLNASAPTGLVGQGVCATGRINLVEGRVALQAADASAVTPAP